MKTLNLPSGKAIPVLGQGTWRMGENRTEQKAELEVLQLGMDMGISLIDTAEMYGVGGAENIVGEAIKGRRDEVFLVSKVYPHNATLKGTVEACKRSLKRLKTDYLDMYLLHWPGSVPLSETLEAFQQLQNEGLIRDYGLSNFDLSGIQKALLLPGGAQIATNQVYYNLLHRGIEWDLLPWCQNNNIPVMSYSPIESSPTDQKGFLDHAAMKAIAAEHKATTAQIAIAWLLHKKVIVIPKSSNPVHLRENFAAIDIQMTAAELGLLDQTFPPPAQKVSLEMR